jgi:soluble cytochrome b562
MSLTKTELLGRIAELSIDDETKAVLADKINKMDEADVATEGMDAVLDAIQQRVDTKQEELDGLYEEAEVKDDEQNPEYRAAFDTMMGEIDTVQKDFQTQMSALEAEAGSIVVAEEAKQVGDLVQQIKGE